MCNPLQFSNGCISLMSMNVSDVDVDVDVFLMLICSMYSPLQTVKPHDRSKFKVPRHLTKVRNNKQLVRTIESWDITPITIVK